MTASLGWIRRFHHSRQLGERPLLLVCPHAGSGASGYREFSKAMHPNFDVVVFQYPGRQDRLREPMPPTLPAVAQGAFADFRESPLAEARQLVVFGHSMGARIAFEFARCAEADGRDVELLCVSAAIPPSRQHLITSPEPTDDEGILDRIALLNGTSRDVLDSQELIRMSLPTLRADYEAINRDTTAPGAKVSARVLALGATDDPIVPTDLLRAWAENTSGGCDVRLFPGAHFYWQSQLDDVASAVVDVFRSPGSSADQEVC